MVYRVVSTKLSEEEHSALLDECGSLGISPSTFVRNVILEALKTEQVPSARVKFDGKKDEPPASDISAVIRKFVEAVNARER